MFSTISPPLHSTRTGPGALQRFAPWLAAALAVVVYACTLNGTYVWDDQALVELDPRVTNGMWKELWTQGYRVDGMDKLYRPLVSTSFALQWMLHGDRAWAFHLVNILLHAGVTFMLTVLARRVFGAVPAVIAGVLFAVLPIHTEAVAGIVGRAESMCALAVLYGLYAFLSEPITPRLLAKLSACFLVAALSKEQGVLFPLLLLGAAPLRRSLGMPPASRAMRTWLVCLFLWLPAGYLVARESLVPMWWDRSQMAWECNPVVRSQGLDRVLLPVVVLGHYVQLLVAPVKLAYDYSGLAIGWKVRLSDPYLYLGAASALALAGGIAWSAWRRSWAMFFALFGLAITYGLVSNTLVVIGTLMAERLAYLPSAFFLLVIGALLSRLPRKVLAPMVALLVVLGAARTIRYAIRWNDRTAFFEWSVENQPRGKYVYSTLFDDDALRDDWPAALNVALRLRSIMPDSADAHYMCMQAHMKLEDWAAVRDDALYALAQPFPPDARTPMKVILAEANGKLHPPPPTTRRDTAPASP